MSKHISKNIINVGVDDFDIDLFEGQYHVQNGISYNSYLVIDEKIALFDSVDSNFCDEWLGNIEAELGDRQPDYLIVQHMEPDHSGSIACFVKKYPDTTIVANAKTFSMIGQFFKFDTEFNKLVVKDGDTLSIGEHSFTFVFAPMVHWPEVMVTYDSSSRTLFSADAFGTFGVYKENEDFDICDWAAEASRYYFGIVGKYGAQVQSLLKKAKGLEITSICSLHGPYLNKNIDEVLSLYDTWSAYQNEKDGVIIAYASAYGNTAKAAEILYNSLKSNGMENVFIYDLSRCDMSKAVADAFRYSKLVLASITYNADVFPVMSSFLHGLVERNFQNKFVGFIENGSWAPMASKVMRSAFEKSKNLTFAENNVTIKSALDESSHSQIAELVKELQIL